MMMEAETAPATLRLTFLQGIPKLNCLLIFHDFDNAALRPLISNHLQCEMLCSSYHAGVALGPLPYIESIGDMYNKGPSGIQCTNPGVSDCLGHKMERVKRGMRSHPVHP